MSRKLPRARILLLVAVPLLALLAVVVLLLSLRNSVAQAIVAPRSVGAAGANALHAVRRDLQEPPDAIATPTSGPDAPAAAIAVVNGAAITPGDFATAQAVDRIMSALSGLAAAPSPRLLEELINTELVWQAMPAMSDPPAGDAAERLSSLLARAGASEQTLDAALAGAAITRAGFDRYFARRVAVGQFAGDEARRRGIDEDELLRRLQAAAQISYGPAAARLLSESPAPSLSSLPVAPAATVPATSATTPPATPAIASVADASPPGQGTGALPPAFSLPALAAADAPVTLDDFAGQPLVLSFWTTWCPYCLRQTPVLVEAYTRYATDGIQFVGIDVKEEAAVVAAYVDQHQIPYPIALDPDGAVASLYGVTGYPTTLFIAADGQIAARHLGALTAETVDEYVAQLLRHAQ